MAPKAKSNAANKRFFVHQAAYKLPDKYIKDDLGNPIVQDKKAMASIKNMNASDVNMLANFLKVPIGEDKNATAKNIQDFILNETGQKGNTGNEEIIPKNKKTKTKPKPKPPPKKTKTNKTKNKKIKNKNQKNKKQKNKHKNKK